MTSSAKHLFAAVSSALLLPSGCSVKLNREATAEPPWTRTDSISLQVPATGIDGKVGWGSLVPFAFPIIPIYVVGGGNAEVTEQLRIALERVGYQVEPVDGAEADGRLTLRLTVERFWFTNAILGFPIVPTWGSIELRTDLVEADGATRWSRTFSAGGSTFNFLNGFTIAANEAMDVIRNDMVSEFASKEFYRALVESPAGEESDSRETP